MPDQSLALPWGAWGAESVQQLPVPAGWQIVRMEMDGAPALSGEALAARLDAPIDCASIADLARSASRAVIAVDDLTRPTRVEPIVSAVLDRLALGGLPMDAVSVLVATGAHAPLGPDGLRRKLGAVVDRVDVLSHSQDATFLDTEATLAGVPVRLNERFLQADLRIGIGAVLPHPFAGFSGGGKVVVPGVADLDVLARTHKFGLMGLTGGQHLDANRFRMSMEAAVRQIGLQCSINVVVNAQRETCGLFCGDMVTAHRDAAAFGRLVGATPRPSRPLDALILNAYPKDNELLQIEAAFVALQHGFLSTVTDEAPIVLAASCEFGLGHHGLFGPGGRLFRKPVRKGLLGTRPLLVFAPGCSTEEVRLAFWDGYQHCQTWEEVVTTLAPMMPEAATVGVVPCAPLQLTDGSHAGG